MVFSNQSLQGTCHSKSLTNQILEMTTLSIIGFVAIVGNSLVIGVITRSHRVQWVTNLFVAHLAAVNLTVPIISTPFYFHWSLFRKWALGDATCKLVHFLHLLNAGVSVCMLACIAFDRYYVVVHPLTLHLRRSQTFQLITFIWIFVIFMCTPSLYFFKLKNAECGVICSIDSDSNSWGGFFIAYSLCAFLMPLCIMVILYVLVVKAIHERNLLSKLTVTNSVNIAERYSIDGSKYRQKTLGKVPRTKKKVIKMLIIQVIIFMACWVPYFAKEFSKLWSKLQYEPSSLFLWMCFSNSCINPILYTILNSNFRKGCRHLVSLQISQPYTLQALQRRHQVGIAESSHRGSDDEDIVRASNNAHAKQNGDGHLFGHEPDTRSAELEDVSSIKDGNTTKVIKMFQVSSTSGTDAWS